MAVVLCAVVERGILPFAIIIFYEKNNTLSLDNNGLRLLLSTAVVTMTCYNTVAQVCVAALIGVLT